MFSFSSMFTIGTIELEDSNGGSTAIDGFDRNQNDLGAI